MSKVNVKRLEVSNRVGRLTDEFLVACEIKENGGPRNLIIWNFKLVKGNGDSKDGRKRFGSDCDINIFNKRVGNGIDVVSKIQQLEFFSMGCSRITLISRSDQRRD